MKKLLLAICVIVSIGAANAQTKYKSVLIQKDATQVSKPYHGFKNPDRGYETTLSIDEVKIAFRALFTGTDVATIDYWWHTKRVSIAELQSYWLNHFNSIFGQSYTGTTELLPYVDRMVLKPWPSHELAVAHFGNSDGKTVFGARNRSMRVPDEQVIDVDDKTIGSNVCLNGADDLFGSKTNSLQSVNNSLLPNAVMAAPAPIKKQEAGGLLGLPPLPAETKKDDYLLEESAKFNSDFRLAANTPVDMSYMNQKQSKPFFKSTAGKVVLGAVAAGIIYYAVKLLLPHGSSGGPVQGGAPAESGGGGPIQGGRMAFPH